MEKVEVHTDEEKKVCDWIKYNRKYDRDNMRYKQIKLPLFIECSYKVYSFSNIKINKITSNVSVSGGIVYKGKKICPTINKPLRCTNRHAVESFYKKRAHIYEISDKKTTIRFSAKCAPNITLLESIHYNKGKNSFCVFSGFYSSHGTKIKYITERTL